VNRLQREVREGREGKAKERHFMAFVAAFELGIKRQHRFSFDFPARPSRPSC
jgi:hypothetical protein